MKTQPFFKIACVLLFTLSSFTTFLAQNLEQKVDDYLKSTYPANEPGVSFLIAKDGKTIYRKAFGMANLELNVPMTPDNVF